MPSTRLQTILDDVPKAQLQRFYLHWFPGTDLLSSKDRLRTDLFGAMTDYQTVRERFDALSRSQRAFLSALLVRGRPFSATVGEVRKDQHGRSIEDYEVESLLKSLQETGYIIRTSRVSDGSEEVYTIPRELGEALRCTVSLEARSALEMLSREVARGSSRALDEEGENQPPTGERPAREDRECGAELLGGDSGESHGGSRSPSGVDLDERVASIGDSTLRSLVTSAVEDYGGILSLSDCLERNLLPAGGNGNPALDRAPWRRRLEALGIGTTGVISLRDYGLDLEEQALVVYQELIYERCVELCQDRFFENDREVSLGADLLIDLDRLPELLRREPSFLTREGNVYKKVDEKLSGRLVLSHNPELVQGSPVQHLFDLARRLRIFDLDAGRVVFDRLRRRGWRQKPLVKKVAQVFDVYLTEDKGQRWSFHQPALRRLVLDELQRISPGNWLVTRPFLTGVVKKYLLGLETNGVRSTYEDERQDNFSHRRLAVTVQSLYHDLSYWVHHRLALLGLVDVGFREGLFHSLRLSRLGHRFFGLALGPDACEGPRLLLNPDFEILIYPEAPDEWNWQVSQFADRVGSDYVKRYRVTRESVKRAIISGWQRDEILEFLRQNSYGTPPANVLFSVREWTEGVEFVRKQKVLLLRAQTKTGADRLAGVLEESEIAYERLNDTMLTVRGAKNERAVRERQGVLRDWGLIVE